MKVLVTGAHGFLGSHITERLIAAGDSVRALATPWGDVRNLSEVRDHPGLELVRADVTDEGSIAGLCDGVDAVVHAAGRVADWGPWDAFYRTNVIGTQHLLQEAVASGSNRFVFISSVAVHRYRGFRDADPRTLPRDNLRNPYAYSKILAEDLVLAQRRLGPVVMRPGLWPFGARDATFQRVLRAIERGMLPVMKHGDRVLNTAYAENFAEGVFLAVHVDRAAGNVYLVADEGMPRWRDVFDTIAEVAGESPPRLNVPRRPATALATGVEVTWSALFPRVEPPVTRYRAGLMAHDVHFSIRHARDELGYEPPVTWREGIRRSLGALERQRSWRP